MTDSISAHFKTTHARDAGLALHLCAWLVLLVFATVFAIDSPRPNSLSNSPGAPSPAEINQNIAMARALLGPGGYEECVRTLWKQGHDLHAHGQLKAARAYLETARAIQDSLAVPDTLSVTEALADVYIDQGFYSDARVLLEARLATLTSTPALAMVDLMGPRYGLARLLVRMGEYSEAERIYKDAIATTRDSLALAYLFNGLGILHDELGNYPEAHDLYENALTCAAAHPDNPILPSVLNNLGYLYMNISDYPAAMENYERALQLHLQRNGESVRSATTLIDIAHVYRLQGQNDRAEDTFKQALSALERILGTDHAYVATCLRDLAETYLETDRPDKALPLFERTLQIRKDRESALRRPHADTWNALLGLAKVHDMSDDLTAAGRLYSEALSARESVVGRDNPQCAEALRDLAWFQTRTGHTSDALALAMRAEELSREQARLLASSLPERQALRYAAVRYDGLHLTLNLAAKDPREQTIQAAWDVVVKSRALVLDEIAARHRRLRFDDPEIRQLAVAYEAASRRLGHLILASGNDPENLAERDQIDEARRDRERLERELAQLSPEFRREESRHAIGFAAVRAVMPPDAALVSFVRYERWSPESGVHRILERQGSPERDYLAFILPTAHRDPRIVHLGPAAPIDRMVREWSREIGETPRSDRDSARARYRSVAAQLRSLVWDPVVRQLGEPTLVFVVPDGELQRVSFAALPIGDENYLIDSGLRFHYLSAERDIAHDLPGADFGSGILAIGGVDYNTSLAPVSISAIPASTFTTGTAFQPLSSTAEEALNAVESWQRSQHAAESKEVRSSPVTPSSDYGALLLTGSSATEEAFKRQAPGRSIVHIATHGFFLDRGGRSLQQNTRHLQTGMSSQSSSRTRIINAMALVSPNASPLRLSGLALAGANRFREMGPNDEDGILTAEEIAAINLRGVEWVVLSACETGVGAVQDVEGILGLRRAFQVAGAHALIMSLWEVDDRSTRQWMKELYHQRFENDCSIVESVHRASTSVLNTQRSTALGEHPFYWAAFVGAGDWQ